MRRMNSGRWALALAGLIGVAVLTGWSAPASAVDVTDCGDFRSSTASRFDIKNNISTLTQGATCLRFPRNAMVFLNGWTVSGPTGSDPSVPTSVGIAMSTDGFVMGPGIVKQFGVCIGGNFNAAVPPVMQAPDDVAVEYVVLNQCGTGIWLRDSYKVKEVRIHDCHPSAWPGYGMILRQGGFVESSIVRSCDTGVLTGFNNKIWNLVVTGHSFYGLQVASGNAVSRTVISHPTSNTTIGIGYLCFVGAGCQDGSNSVEDHTAGLNIITAGPYVITQGTDAPLLSATNCGGVPADKNAAGILEPVANAC